MLIPVGDCLSVAGWFCQRVGYVVVWWHWLWLESQSERWQRLLWGWCVLFETRDYLEGPNISAWVSGFTVTESLRKHTGVLPCTNRLCFVAGVGAASAHMAGLLTGLTALSGRVFGGLLILGEPHCTPFLHAASNCLSTLNCHNNSQVYFLRTGLMW